jgi:hypothetical protein
MATSSTHHAAAPQGRADDHRDAGPPASLAEALRLAASQATPRAVAVWLRALAGDLGDARPAVADSDTS